MAELEKVTVYNPYKPRKLTLTLDERLEKEERERRECLEVTRRSIDARLGKLA
jgi:hypothetical protein